MVTHVPLQVVGDLIASDIGRLGGVANKMALTHIVQHLRSNCRVHSEGGGESSITTLSPFLTHLLKNLEQ